MSYEAMNEARNLVNDLYRTLEKMVEKDSEQEVWSYSYGVIDAVLQQAAGHLEGHPVVAQVREVFSPDRVVEGQPVRAVDLLPTVGALRAFSTAALARWRP